jgi:ABC-type branched-subunit amino acid transport system substrate-binding protein
VAEFHADMKSAGTPESIGFISLEGYLAGKTFCAALAQAGAEPTRVGLLAAFTAMTAHDLGGITLGFGPADNQALDQVFLTELTATGVQPIANGAFANVEVGE